MKLTKILIIIRSSFWTRCTIKKKNANIRIDTTPLSSMVALVCILMDPPLTKSECNNWMPPSPLIARYHLRILLLISEIKGIINFYFPDFCRYRSWFAYIRSTFEAKSRSNSTKTFISQKFQIIWAATRFKHHNCRIRKGARETFFVVLLKGFPVSPQDQVTTGHYGRNVKFFAHIPVLCTLFTIKGFCPCKGKTIK